MTDLTIRVFILSAVLLCLYLVLRYFKKRIAYGQVNDGDRINVVSRKRISVHSELLIVAVDKEEIVFIMNNGELKQVFTQTPTFKELIND